MSTPMGPKDENKPEIEKVRPITDSDDDDLTPPEDTVSPIPPRAKTREARPLRVNVGSHTHSANPTTAKTNQQALNRAIPNQPTQTTIKKPKTSTTNISPDQRGIAESPHKLLEQFRNDYINHRRLEDLEYEIMRGELLKLNLQDKMEFFSDPIMKGMPNDEFINLGFEVVLKDLQKLKASDESKFKRILEHPEFKKHFNAMRSMSSGGNSNMIKIFQMQNDLENSKKNTTLNTQRSADLQSRMHNVNKNAIDVTNNGTTIKVPNNQKGQTLLPQGNSRTTIKRKSPEPQAQLLQSSPDNQNKKQRKQQQKEHRESSVVTHSDETLMQLKSNIEIAIKENNINWKIMASSQAANELDVFSKTTKQPIGTIEKNEDEVIFKFKEIDPDNAMGILTSTDDDDLEVSSTSLSDIHNLLEAAAETGKKITLDDATQQHVKGLMQADPALATKYPDIEEKINHKAKTRFR